MSDKQSNLTDKEMEDLQGIVTDTLNRYLYKAKTTPKEKEEFNNVWVIGNLIVSDGKYYIHPVDNIVKIRNEIGKIIVMHEVIPDTICQCTGLKDKNGKLIWENDIVKRTDKPKAGEPTIGIIEYDVANTAFIIRWLNVPDYSPTFPWKEKIEVVGNEWDCETFAAEGESKNDNMR